MSGNEPIRRGGTPISANNPFRQSLLLRAESPFEVDYSGASARPSGSVNGPMRASADRHSSQSPTASATVPQRVSSNPFDSEQDSAPASGQDLPPPYDDRRRANSDSSTLNESEKDRLARRYEDSRRRRGESERSDRDRSDRDRERRYREERNRLRAERDRLRAERDRLRAERYKDGKSSSGHRHRYAGSGGGGSSNRRTRERSKSESAKSKAKDGPSLDVIDKMDVTGLFGPGSFHHDGPFDACTPHRNRDNQQGPVAAFPANGPNNSLAMDAPDLVRYKQEQVVFGRDPEADGFPETADPTERSKPVHGNTTMGLGSTTFVDGTPASAKAISEADHDDQVAASMGRTRSILRRQNPRRPPPETAASRQNDLTARTSNPERRLSSDDEKPSGLLGRVKSLRISRR